MIPEWLYTIGSLAGLVALPFAVKDWLMDRRKEKAMKKAKVKP